MAKKRLRRSSNRVFLGVLGGFAEYFEADPMHVRLLWAVITIIVGLLAGAIAYALVPAALTLWIILYVVAFLAMSEAPGE